MSVKGLIGGIAGGVIGFFIGGPVGVMWGASIGFGVGMALDPIQPDTPVPGQMSEVQVTTARHGDPIPDLLGTIELTGNIIWYCCDYTVEETEEAEGGKGGGSQSVVTGYKYYLSWAMSLCMGPIDTLYTIYKDEEVVWEGGLDRPVSGGQRSIYIAALETTIVFFYGTDDQEPLAALCHNLEAGNITGGPGNPVGTGACDNDANLNVPYRHLCWVYIPNAYIGGYNRAPTLKFVLKKRPTITDKDGHDIPYGDIGPFDYNPAHAVWYIQETLAGLPKSFLHSISFEAVALTLHSEQRGVSILFAQRQAALTYIESVNAHADMIERFDIDGSLHLKLIRADEDISSLPVINKSMLVEDPVINRPSWLGAVNEVKVVFSERFFGECTDASVLAIDPATPTSIGPNEDITLSIDGGCPPFEWEIITEDSGCTLSEAETLERENTLSSGNCVVASVVIRATDSVGSTVDFTITGESDLAFDDVHTPDSVAANECIDLYILGGGAPFTWEIVLIDDEEYTLTHAQTTGRENELCAGCCIDDQVTIRVTDSCGWAVQFTIDGVPMDFVFDDDSTPDTIAPNSSISVYVIGGCPPFTWITGAIGYSFGSAETEGRVNTLHCVGGVCGVDYDPYATVYVTDACGNMVQAIIRNTAGGWVLKEGPINAVMVSQPPYGCISYNSCVPASVDVIQGYQKWALAFLRCWRYRPDLGGTCSFPSWNGGSNPPPCGGPEPCGAMYGENCPWCNAAPGCPSMNTCFRVSQRYYYYEWEC